MSTFVSVGNAKQPFTRLLDGILRILPSLPKPVVVQHGHTPFFAKDCVAYPFVGEAEFGRHVAEAELVILHGGAGSVIHAVHAGKIPVVMARRGKYGEHVDDHQVEFVSALAVSGKVILAKEPEDLNAAVEDAKKQQSSVRALGATSPLLVGLVTNVLRDYALELEEVKCRM